MTTPFPHHYEVDLNWKGGAQAALTSGLRPLLMGGAPPEFGGPATVWSPEHLLLSAANLCLMNTFMAIAARSGVVLDGYRSRAEGVLEKTSRGIEFTRIRLRVEMECAPEVKERAEKALETAKKYCIVSNALKHPVEVEVLVSAPLA